MSDLGISMILLKKGSENLLKFILKSLSENKSAIDTLGKSINRAENLLQEAAIAPLKSGYSFLRLGRFDDALKSFVYAEAQNEYSPVAKLCLSGMIYKTNEDYGIEKLKEALNINPFILFETGFDKKIENLNKKYKLNFSKKKENFWKQDLHQSVFIQEARKNIKDWWRIVNRGNGNKKIFSIRALSLNVNHPVLLWDYDDIRILSVINRNTGIPLWSKRIEDKELCLTTPLYIVLRTKKNPFVYELVKLQNGNTAYEMREKYYHSLFSPNQNILEKTPEYKKSNRLFYDESEVMESNYNDRALKWHEFSIDRDFVFSEKIQLSGPFGFNMYEIEANNTWKYRERTTLNGMIHKTLFCEGSLSGKDELNDEL